MNEQSNSGLYSTAEAAKYLGVHIQTLKYHVYRGNVRPVKVGKTLVFPQDVLDQFLTQHWPGRSPVQEGDEPGSGEGPDPGPCEGEGDAGGGQQ